jgi:hypothetical protein
MIGCHCNYILCETFKAAVEAKREEIEAAPALLDAVGIAYRHARENNPKNVIVKIPSCTTCFSQLATYIQAEGLFPEEALPPRSWDDDCARRAQCFEPAGASAPLCDGFFPLFGR